MRVSAAGLAACLGALPGLAELSLRGCAQLPDALCAAVAALPALARLNLQACERFTGARGGEGRRVCQCSGSKV